MNHLVKKWSKAKPHQESPLKALVKRLREAAEEEEGSTLTEEGGDSLDAQVDEYLTQYESEAASVKAEGRDFRRTTRRLLRGILSEAEDDAGVEPEKKNVDSIDVEAFANNVVRMIENYDNLLEVKSTLIRRAKNHLSKVYDDEVLETFDSIMKEQHGLEAGKTSDEVKGTEFQAPPAERAGDGGGGAGGAPA